jgi:hypothetical protein
MKTFFPIPRLICCSLFVLFAAVVAAETPVVEQTITGTKKIGEINQPWRIRTLPLASFPEMPTAMRMQMEARRCMIPQSYEAHRPENLVHGSFYALDKTDWAALCLAEGEVSLLVYRSGAAALVDLMRVDLADTVGPTGKPHEPFGFYLAIDAIPPRRVRQFSRSNASVLDSIEVSIVDGNSVIHQWDGEAWIQLAGVQL